MRTKRNQPVEPPGGWRRMNRIRKTDLDDVPKKGGESKWTKTWGREGGGVGRGGGVKKKHTVFAAITKRGEVTSEEDERTAE